jgi:hypothetical protein
MKMPELSKKKWSTVASIEGFSGNSHPKTSNFGNHFQTC